jgi:acetyl esterase/lipase
MARVQLEPEAEAFAQATANPPFLFDLGPEKGRTAVDEVQSSRAAKPAVEIQDLTIPDGPSVQVAICIVRPPNSPTALPGIVYIHGACHSVATGRVGYAVARRRQASSAANRLSERRASGNPDKARKGAHVGNNR